MAFRRSKRLRSNRGGRLPSTKRGKMGSTAEASLPGHNLYSERGKPTGVCNAVPGTPQELGLGLEFWSPWNPEGKRGLPVQGCELLKEEEDMQSGGSVHWDCEAIPGSPAHKEGYALDFVPHLPVKSADIMKQLTIQEVQSSRRYQSQESWITELSGIWANAEACPSRRGALTPNSFKTTQGSAARLQHPSGPRAGLVWGKPQTGTKSRRMGSADAQQPSSNPESSDELSEIQLTRVSICPRGGGQARSCSPRELGDPARSTSVHSTENFLNMPGSLPTTTFPRLTPAMNRQAFTELEASACNKIQSLLWGKGGTRPSYPGAASAAAAGSLPRATPRIKTIQEMKSFGSGSKVTMDRTLPSWEQRLREEPLEAVTFPPVSSVGRAKRFCLLPLEPPWPMHSGPKRRYIPDMPQTTWEFQPEANEDDDANRVAVTQAQVSLPSSFS
ncbi:hypothetical protein H1C71_030536 [Ictidomys tridecemlineatus]|nr:hypothetical protein H1C71_030536 [Ictidomys tridecemlineatus]